MDKNWGTFSLFLWWCVMYNDLQPSIYVLTPLSIHQWIHGWDNTTSKARASASFNQSMVVCPWSVVWPVWTWSPCLVAHIVVYLPHPYTYRWIEKSVNTYMYDWSSWYITQHPRQEQDVCQFSSIHGGPSLGWCVVSMYVIPWFDCLYNGVST